MPFDSPASPPTREAGPGSADSGAPQRSFVPATVADVAPLPAQRASKTGGRRRDVLLRAALFCSLLGGVLTVISAWMQAGQDRLAPFNPAGMASFHEILMPLLALAAVVGALILERSATGGMVMMLVATGLGLGGGAVWMLPGLALACIWAARQSIAARATLGFLLLLPGIAAGYWGVLGALGYLAREQVGGLPPGLSTPLSLGQALAPLELLPLAVLGAWLLVDRRPPAESPQG